MPEEDTVEKGARVTLTLTVSGWDWLWIAVAIAAISFIWGFFRVIGVLAANDFMIWWEGR